MVSAAITVLRSSSSTYLRTQLDVFQALAQLWSSAKALASRGWMWLPDILITGSGSWTTLSLPSSVFGMDHCVVWVAQVRLQRCRLEPFSGGGAGRSQQFSPVDN